MVLQASAVPERTGHTVGFEKGARAARDARHTVA